VPRRLNTAVTAPSHHDDGSSIGMPLQVWEGGQMRLYLLSAKGAV
jgi:hypothetical protein